MELKESKDNEMQAEKKFTAQSEQWKTEMKWRVKLGRLKEKQERTDQALKNLTLTRSQLTQTEANLSRQKIETDELNKKVKIP